MLAFTGSIGGLVIIYILPVMVHLKRKHTQITNPLLAEAIARSEFKIIGKNNPHSEDHLKGDKSPKIAIPDRLIGTDNGPIDIGLTACSGESQNGTSQRASGEDKRSPVVVKRLLRKFYLHCFLHSFIPIYGLIVVVMQFIPNRYLY